MKIFRRLATLGATLAAITTTWAATCNVRDFGAVGDGLAKDTRAFQQALDACAVQGGGEVLVPAGRYLIGSVQLGQRTILRLAPDSVLLGSPEAADYPTLDIRWEGRMQPGRRALIHAADVEHIGIVGPGRIEGNPAMAAPQNPRGSVVLEAMHCRDVRWEGFTVTQGGNWATHPTFCTDVVIRGLTIRGQRDGIDVDSCRRVRIEDCDIETGDDAISLKSGRGLDGARLGQPTEDVVITGCRLVCTRFAAIGIGSETSAGVHRVRIERSQLTGKTHAIYIKSRIGRAGTTSDITADDLDVHGGGFLRINLISAGNKNTVDDPVPGAAGIPVARALSFTRIRLHDVASIVEADQIPPESPLVGLRLHQLSGTARKGLVLAHVRQADIGDITVTLSAGALVSATDVEGRLP